MEEDTDFNFEKIKSFVKENQYEKRLSTLSKNGLYVDNIKEVVETSLKNLKERKNSFIIYGEPQSGKTEMMIALTAKLLDEGYKIIIILITDHLTLLNQNLNRFKNSKINPAPKNFTEIMDSNIEIGDKPLVVFCKKNSRDLQKLISRLKGHGQKIVIDDEADYATPNSRVNRENEVSMIYGLTGKLLFGGGSFIGVTATPARLDLNNTHKNKTSKWIYFKPHPSYTGQEDFFPKDPSSVKYTLNYLPDENNPKYLKEAVFNFFINVAHLNLDPPEEGYSMLIHTSGKKIDHSEDKKHIIKIINLLSNPNVPKSKEWYEEIWKLARKKYPGEENKITRYIMKNVRRNDVIVLNSDRDKNMDTGRPTNPSLPFTIIIGGNIVSRGVTFKRLLSMFFTRNVKRTFHQDTYIQRARMFGSRKNYLEYFELTIPEELYRNWHACFVMHRLFLQSIISGNGPPVWPYNDKVFPTNRSSIDRSTVANDSGEMGFEIFEYDKDKIEKIINSKKSPLDKLEEISKEFGNKSLPGYLLSYIGTTSQGENSIAIRSSEDIKNRGGDTDKENISRSKGFISFSSQVRKKYPNAVHHIQIVYNSDNKKARVFYKYDSLGMIGFMRNISDNK